MAATVNVQTCSFSFLDPSHISVADWNNNNILTWHMYKTYYTLNFKVIPMGKLIAQ